MNEVFNIYCDESCHLEHDEQKVMGIGAITCPTRYAQMVNHELKWLKKQYNMPDGYELKWTKTGKGKLDYYLAVIDYFINHSFLRFRGYMVPDKNVIDHSLIEGQTHNQWYYKMYYQMLKPLVENVHNEYRIYIDIKDTRGYEKVEELKDILRTGTRDYAHNRIVRIQEVRSHEVELLQLADFVLGAVVYRNRGEFNSDAKRSVIEHLEKCSGYNLTHSTSYNSNKINLWMWNGRKK